MESVFPNHCAETVGILYAVIFGAGDACVSISMASILTALVAFIGLVIVAQFIARRLWARLTAPRVRQDIGEHGAIRDDPDYTDSPIKSSRRI